MQDMPERIIQGVVAQGDSMRGIYIGCGLAMAIWMPLVWWLA